MTLDRTILVFGATGMLGSAIYNYIALGDEFNVVGTYRTDRILDGLVQNASSTLVQCELDPGALNATALIEKIKPFAVINCVGVIKQRSEASEVLATVPLNTLLPHQLHSTSARVGAKFIHYSNQVKSNCIIPCSPQNPKFLVCDDPEVV